MTPVRMTLAAEAVMGHTWRVAVVSQLAARAGLAALTAMMLVERMADGLLIVTQLVTLLEIERLEREDHG